MAEIDILTPTYRNHQKLSIYLRTLVERTKYVDYKLHLLANDPNEEIKKTIQDAIFLDEIPFTDRINPIFSDDNDGNFSSYNNYLAQQGTAPYILLANDDIEPLHDTWLLNMKQILDKDPKLGAVGALLLYPGREKIQHCGVFFSRKTNNLPFHMFYKQPVKKVGSFISVPRIYQAVTGACMLVRREDFENLGGLNEDYNWGFEDVDLCLRIKKRFGRKSLYTPQTQLIHHEGISGTFKEHPHLKNNIEVFRKECDGLWQDDYDFYLGVKNFMIYSS